MKIWMVLLIILGTPLYFLLLAALIDITTCTIFEILDNVEDIKDKLYYLKHRK